MIRNDITIRPETREDYPVIEQLVLRAFAEHTGYSDGTGEVALINELRASHYYRPELAFVALLEGEIVGHVMFTAFPLSPGPDGGYDPEAEPDFALMAPVAVHADHYRKGIGETMLRLCLEVVRQKDFKGILVEGDFHFYNRLGFETSADYGIHATSGFPLEEPRCMMCMETRPGSLKGVEGYVVYDMYENA